MRYLADDDHLITVHKAAAFKVVNGRLDHTTDFKWFMWKNGNDESVLMPTAWEPVP